MDDLIGKVFITVVVIFGLFAAYIVFVGMPVMLYTEAECLRKGYPESRVSIGLERYCMNLDGSITVQVDKQ